MILSSLYYGFPSLKGEGDQRTHSSPPLRTKGVNIGLEDSICKFFREKIYLINQMSKIGEKLGIVNLVLSKLLFYVLASRDHK